MSKNPLLNALAAILYIAIIVFVVFNLVDGDLEPEILAPFIMISLFTLSAAVMGYLFVLEPLKLYLDGNKKEGANLFLQTVGIFAGIVAILLLIVFLRL